MTSESNETKREDWRFVVSKVSPAPTGTSVTTAWQVNSVVYGENIKDWRKRKAEGRSVTTAMDGIRYALSASPFSYRYTTSGIQHLYSGQRHEFSSWPVAPDAFLVNQATARAQQKFAKKVRRDFTTFQGGVAAAEMRETVRMLASPTMRLRKECFNLLEQMLTLKRRFRRRDQRGLEESISRESRRALASLRNAIADTWLEWSFGVKPLINDSQDAYMALQKMHYGRRVETLRFNASAVAEKASTKTANLVLGIYPGAAGSVTVDERIHEKVEVTFKGAYVYRRPDGNIALPDLFGVDLSSIAPATWEAIPWSFFVDYFTDVGSAIEAASIRLIEFGWVNVTTRSSTTHSHVNPRTLAYLPSAEFWCPYPHVAKVSVHKVLRQAGFPAMAPYVPQFEVPALLDENGNISNKWLNISALLNGILSLKR